MTSLRNHFEDTGCRINLGTDLLSYNFRHLVRLDSGDPGLSADEVAGITSQLQSAEAAVATLRRTGHASGSTEPVIFPRLCRLDDPSAPNHEASIVALERWAEHRRGRVDVVVCLGIGGSYLGNRLLHEALRGRYWNQLTRDERQGWPQLHFAGHHLDALAATDLLEVLRSQARLRSEDDPLSVETVVISKSGTTLEPLAQLSRLWAALAETANLRLTATVITGPNTPLRELAREEGHALLTAPDGVGGRFGALSETGLATAALAGSDVRALLSGAAELDVAVTDAGDDLGRNAALLYAGLHHVCHRLHGRSGAVLMPFSNRLEALSQWYVQLLAESLGKAHDRRGNQVNTGRTPIAAVGTTDMHAQTQIHQDGPPDKTVTTVDLLDWGQEDPPLATTTLARRVAAMVDGKRLSQLNQAAREANETALANAGRPSDSLTMARLDERCLGALIQFLMLATVYEGELLDVNAFDQPGVEHYKCLMRRDLDK